MKRITLTTNQIYIYIALEVVMINITSIID